MSEIINNVSRVPDSSIDYYKAYRSKNFYKGTSFRFLGEWTLGEHYFNDEYLIDFVSYKGTLLACKKSHIATVSNIPDLIINERKEVTGVTSEVWNYAFSSLPAPEVTIDSVITGEPGSNANVEDVGEIPDVALKFTIPSGLSGAYAIHVGPESPIDFKNAHLDNKNIQAAYKYAEDMMWVDTTESSNNQAIQAVYTAFMQSGGTGTIDSFKSALKELINIKNKVSNIEEGATKTIVVDNITTDSSTSALSARQGVVLDNEITSTRNDLLSEMKDPASLADSLIYHKGDTIYDKNDVKLNPITEASKVATSADAAYNTQELLNIHVVDKLDQHDNAVITLTNNKVDKVTGKQLSQEDFTTILKNKLNSIETEANKTIVIDNLTTVSTTYALSAKQGNILLSLINSIKQFNIVKVDTLPETGVANTLYLVPVTSPDESNYFNEYLWIDSKWELIGTTKVDLSNYYTKEQVDTLLKDPTKLPADSVYMFSEGNTSGYLKINNVSFNPVTVAKQVMLPMGDLSYMTQLQWNQHIHRDKVNNSQIVQGLGSSTTNIPSQKALTDELDKKVQSFVIKCNIPEYGDMMQLQTHALTGVSTSEELGIIYEAVKKSEKNCIVRIANSSGIIDGFTPVLSASYSAEGGVLLTGSSSVFPLVVEIAGVIEFDTITSTYSFSATYMRGVNAGSTTFTMVDNDNVLSFDHSSNPSDADMLNLFSYAASAYNMHLTVFISSNSNLKYKTGTYSSYRTTEDSLIYRVKLNSGAYQLIEIKSNEASDGLVVSEITDDDVAIIKLQFQTNQDIFSILTPLTVLSTATEVEAFIKKADSGSTIIAELYAPDNTEIMYSGQLYATGEAYTGIITAYGIGITVAKEETGVSATSMFLSSTHSKTISISINETGEITVENPENGTTATELIREFLYCYYYGTFSPVVLISDKPEKYKSKILPLYDVREISGTNIKLHFPILNYDTYAHQMIELDVNSITNTITASFINWIFANAEGIVTSAGANGGIQTQETFNTTTLTSLASKANISGSAEQVFNVATPVSDTNATTKAYVDTKSIAFLLFDDTQILAGSYDQVLEAYNLNKPFLVLHKDRGPADRIDCDSKAFSVQISYAYVDGSITEFDYAIYPNGTVSSGASMRLYAPVNGWSDETFAVASPVSPNDATPKSYVDSAIMGNVVEDLTSTSITLTPVANTTYKYGTLSSLTLSSIPNSSNPTFIYFTSGATATTLSYPASTPTMGYMIPAANTSYMLSILNGKLILTSVSNG